MAKNNEEKATAEAKEKKEAEVEVKKEAEAKVKKEAEVEEKAKKDIRFKTLFECKADDQEVIVLIASDGKGRSFYLCDICSTSEKKIRGLVKRFKQNETEFTALIKMLTCKVNTCEKS